jgi:hypothetical protein
MLCQLTNLLNLTCVYQFHENVWNHPEGCALLTPGEPIAKVPRCFAADAPLPSPVFLLNSFASDGPLKAWAAATTGGLASWWTSEYC